MLTGGIAHDFNNLLTGMLGNVSLVLEGLSPDDQIYNDLKNVETTAVRAAELVRQLLAYAGKGQFVAEALDLSALMKEVGELLGTVVSSKATLKYDLAKGLPAVKADATQLRQVAMNLVTNASDALGDEGGDITISTGVMNADKDYLSQTALDDDLPSGRYVFVEVSDTGVGMDEELISKIFDPFVTTNFSGRGLGLAAALGIVRGHSGAIRVDSKPGEGATFRALLPASAQPAVVIQAPKEIEKSWTGKGTVLVVDDEDYVRTLATHILGRAGFDVLTANDGREGIDVFTENVSDIVAVLLDMTMPIMGGGEAFMELRRINADIPVIISSGNAEEDTLRELHGGVPAGFVQKPYRPNALIEKLRQVTG